MDTVYFGARPKPSLTRMLDKQGCRLIYARYKKGVLASLPTCAAVVLHWKSHRDQQVIADAQASGLPVMVITTKLVDAYSAADPLADLYLEEPADDEDITALLIDMITAERDTTIACTDIQGIGRAA
jgi:hypothetical protein